MLAVLKKSIKEKFLPSLLVYSKEEAKKKIAFVKKHYPRAWVHIDVMDGIFVPNTCWCAPQDYKALRIKNRQEIHLMVRNPEKHINAWKKAGAKRIVFHYEATRKPRMVIDSIHTLGMEAYIAINPPTQPEKIRLQLPRVDGILVMGVHPGFAGQKYIGYVTKKIKKIRKLDAHKPIIVDGGVTLLNAEDLLSAGAINLVSTSAVYGDQIK